MGYRGPTFIVPFSQGGLFDDPNYDNALPTSMIHPTRNLNLHNNGREKRGGTTHVDAAVMPDTPYVMGLFDFRLNNGNRFIIRALKDGKVYKDDTTAIKTGMSILNWYSFEVMEDTLYICDGETRPQTWDGAAGATSDITSVPADWATGYPQQLIKHGYGNSERLWAFKTSSYPNRVYASANGDGQDFSDANVITLSIETGDGFGIVGGVEFGDRLFAFGKRHAFILEDSDPDTANWGYTASQWEGGVASWRLIVKTPNDVIAMMEDGEIYSIVAVQSYGDYKVASLTRPSFMHRWIKDNVNLAYIDSFHSVYDPVLRAIKIFVVRNGKTTVDTALIYFIDRNPTDAWMVHDNQSYVSGYSASCSAIVRAAAGNYLVYTGDYAGFVWKLEQANKNDNSNGYYSGFKTPLISMDNPRTEKMFKRGWMSVRPKGSYNLYVNWWADATQQTQQSVSLAGAGAVLDSFILDTDVLSGSETIDVPFDLGNRGKRIQFEVFNSVANQDFYLAKMMIDHKPLSARPS